MWWRALGVKATDDKETVKKAYSTLIKTVDQDKDIEQFTNIHRSYRMAMKSFKKEDHNAPEGLIDYNDEAHWYLLELAKIYNNPKRRLNTADWRNLFACMSFIEEKHFLSQYVLFFNEHYALTEDIWALIEKYYPLSNKKEFRWPELVKGHMRISEQEIQGLPFDRASNYVTYKIHSYYALLDGDYDRSLLFIQLLLKDYNKKDINRWYLLCVIELGLSDEVVEGYNRLRNMSGSTYMADYIYAGYLMGEGDYDKAQELLSGMSEENQDSRIRELLDECHGKVLPHHKVHHKNKPWLELEVVSAKSRKLLAKGDYTKALQSDGGRKFKLWGRR